MMRYYFYSFVFSGGFGNNCRANLGGFDFVGATQYETSLYGEKVPVIITNWHEITELDFLKYSALVSNQHKREQLKTLVRQKKHLKLLAVPTAVSPIAPTPTPTPKDEKDENKTN